MADIFISYKREDQEEKGRVAPIAEALRAEGYDVFYDVQVPPGSSWEAYLQSKIDEARVVLVLWSQHSVASDWVKEEAEMAKNAAKLIPVFLDAVAPPFGFARIEGANLSNWDGDLQHIEWRGLVAALKSRIGDGEVAAQPGVTRVPYSPAPVKSVEITKTAPSRGGGATKWIVGLVSLAALVAISLFAWGSLRQADVMTGQAEDAAFDRAMTRQIDENAWRDANAGGTITDYRRYLALRPTGAYRADALDAIAALEADAAAATRAQPSPSGREPAPSDPVPATPSPAPTGEADLRITALTLGSAQVDAGGTMRATVEVANVGGTLAPGSSSSGYMVDFVLSRDASAPVRWARFSETWSEDAMPRGGRASNTRDIPPGSAQSYTTSMTIPGDWPAGRFYLCAVVDPGQTVAERSEDNNTGCTPLEVTRGRASP